MQNQNLGELYEKYRREIRSKLTEKRYHHSLCVADEARRLAQKYGADGEKAYAAGLLHDIAKDMDRDTMLQTLDKFGIMLDMVEKKEPKLWHAIAGEGYARLVLGVRDADILAAIRCHTTARAGMSLLETVLYIADFTSADRDYDDVGEMRERAESSLDEAMIYALQYTVSDLASRGKLIHPDTIAAYNERLLHRAANAF